MQRPNANRSASNKYAKALMKLAKQSEDKIIMPVVREAVADIVYESAKIAPFNMGTLRGLFTATVNGSGTLSKSSSLDAIRANAIKNLKKAKKLTDQISIENQAPYAEQYEFGLFEPATPKYSKLGGSEARHVPKGRRGEKLGKVLILSGFNVTAPSGMVQDALQIVNARLASGTYKLGKFKLS